MPTRLRVSLDDTDDWTASLAGQRVTLAGDDGAESVYDVTSAEAGRLRAAGPAGVVAGVAAAGGDAVWVSIAGHVFECHVGHATAARARARDAVALMAPMPATVTRIAVKVGDAVSQGDVLISLEAMKMEMPIRAPHDFVVAAIHCAEGDLVQPGTVLIQ